MLWQHFGHTFGRDDDDEYDGAPGDNSSNFKWLTLTMNHALNRTYTFVYYIHVILPPFGVFLFVTMYIRTYLLIRFMEFYVGMNSMVAQKRV